MLLLREDSNAKEFKLTSPQSAVGTVGAVMKSCWDYLQALNA